MSVHKTDREQLIEESAKAMQRVVYSGAPSWPDTGKHIREQWRTVARAALAVFEQAHTPIDDERELRTLRDVAKTYDTNFPCDGGCNVNDGPEETCSRHGRSPRDLWNLLDAARRTLQGEPTDAELQAAAEAFAFAPYASHDAGVLEPLRAALKAAAAVREEGQGHGE